MNKQTFRAEGRDLHVGIGTSLENEFRIKENESGKLPLNPLCIPFQVLDYTQYYLDLEAANSKKDGAPVWQSEYNLTTYYHGLGEISRDVSAVSLHNLADRFTNPEDILFSK